MTAKAFTALVDRNLRQPYQPPVKAVETLPAEKTKIKVVGLMIEPPNSCAVLTDDKGQRAIKGVGDTFSDMKILAIDEAGVTAECNGQKYFLKVEKQ